MLSAGSLPLRILAGEIRKEELHMQNRRYVLILAIALCFGGWVAQAQRSSSPARQTWEYKTILRSRSFVPSEENPIRAAEWESWSENGKRLASPVDIGAKLKELGEQGWELTSVTARSSLLGGHESSDEGGVSADYAGLTS